MALIDKIFGRKKTLSELDKTELRKEEILLTKQRDRLFTRISQISDQKQQIFKQGATQKSPELRKALAQDFEIKTQEQLLSARELNLRSKELLTVSRLRMIRENKDRGKALGRLNITDKDVAKISGLIEDDSITQDMYRQRLDSLLEIGSASDQDAMASAGLTSAGQELLNIWDDLDRGAVKHEQAFEQADQAVRRKAAAADGGGV
jgi:Asp-tRNA(Asn)/Glu-tRNA(Gln) amidotransferase B subunit